MRSEELSKRAIWPQQEHLGDKLNQEDWQKGKPELLSRGAKVLMRKSALKQTKTCDSRANLGHRSVIGASKQKTSGLEKGPRSPDQEPVTASDGCVLFPF